MAVTESICETERHIIPMADVMFIEKNGDNEICVVLRGATHPTDRDGQLISGYGRADCPYLGGEDKTKFLAAWCRYRREREIADLIEQNVAVEE
jgi:hypothetical protein